MADLRSYTWLVVVGALAAFLFGFGTGAPGWAARSTRKGGGSA